MDPWPGPTPGVPPMTGRTTPPRRGFTQALSEEKVTTLPVVVGLNHSPMSTLVLLRAADEAAHRSAHLHVVVSGSAEESIASAAVDEREMHTISSILRNRHVTIYPLESADADSLLRYCRDVGASLLVVGCDDSAAEEDLENPTTAHRLVDEAECDVLVVHGDDRHSHH